ncbi:MAG: exonuclease SbcCD subunit D [Bacteroidales bacterium]|nr:exonuclease SbcCD subunit D [Bacteroidales bacterium]
MLRKMKVIHTSDWHIGQTLYQYSRDEEHKYFFNQLKDIVLEEKPDALIVSGDIFHASTPSVMSQRLYYHALVELSRLYDDLQIIVTAGNHDSPSRLEAPRELWEAFNVTVIGNLDFYKEVQENGLTYDASKIQIPVRKNDEVVGWILAVPFINAGNYPSLKENDCYSKRVFSFYNNLKDNLKLNKQYTENHSVISMGHFMISGVDSASQNKLTGGLESVVSTEMSAIPGIDYWAMGHVHHPQNVGENIRYSGSPFAMTFNEIYPHSITIVEIENHNVDIKIREIEPLVPVIDFPFKPNSYDDAPSKDELFAEVVKVLDNECYVRLHVRTEMPLSDMDNARIQELFEGKNAKYCGIQAYFHVNESDCEEKSVRTLDEFRAISPYDLGCSVYKKKNNAEMPDEMRALFKEVCDEVMKF